MNVKVVSVHDYNTLFAVFMHAGGEVLHKLSSVVLSF